VGVKLVTVGAPITVNEAELDPEPAGVVTVMTPLEAPAGTSAVICMAELTVKFATPTSVVLNFTEVAPVKLVPLIVTLAPMIPDAGVKLVTVGAPIIVNEAELEPEPAGVVTVMTPLEAPAGTWAVICVGELTVKFAARTTVVLNFTDDTFMKLVPVIVTLAPTCPEVGVKLTTVGGS